MAQIRTKTSYDVNIPHDYEEKFDTKTFVTRLEELLESMHMTQVTLAEKLNVTPLTIARWKKDSSNAADGRKKPVPYRQIYNMAKIFHVNAEYLYNSECQEKRKLDKWKTLGEKYSKEMKEITEQQLKKYTPLLDYLKSIGYDVAIYDWAGCIVLSKNNFKSTIHLTDNLAEKIEHLVKYTLLSEETEEHYK